MTQFSVGKVYGGVGGLRARRRDLMPRTISDFLVFFYLFYVVVFGYFKHAQA